MSLPRLIGKKQPQEWAQGSDREWTFPNFESSLESNVGIPGLDYKQGLLSLLLALRECENLSRLNLPVQTLLEQLNLLDHLIRGLEQLSNFSRTACDKLAEQRTYFLEAYKKSVIVPQDISKTIVAVKAKNSKGTGFIVKRAEAYYVITCDHLLGETELPKICIRDADEWKKITCSKPCRNSDADVAIFPVLTRYGLTGIPFPESTFVELGEFYTKMLMEVIVYPLLYRYEALPCSRQKGHIKVYYGQEAELDIGHPEHGWSGAPVLFPLMHGNEESVFLGGMFTARKLEKIVENGVERGRQVISGMMVSVSQMVQTFEM